MSGSHFFQRSMMVNDKEEVYVSMRKTTSERTEQMNDRSYFSLHCRECKRKKQRAAILLIKTNIYKEINRSDVHF